jgi:hypothetical protein
MKGFLAESTVFESSRMQEALIGSCLPPMKQSAEDMDLESTKSRKKSLACKSRVKGIEQTLAPTWYSGTKGHQQRSVLPPVELGTSKCSRKVERSKGQTRKRAKRQASY